MNLSFPVLLFVGLLAASISMIRRSAGTDKEDEQRLKKALEQFYLSEFENTKAALFASGELTEEMISQGAATHFRTAY